MMTYLTSSPLWLVGLMLVVLPSVVAMLCLVAIRRSVGFDRLRANNEVAGFKFATVGVLYAVLLAFAVIVVWEKFSDAEKDVALEAGAAATIYRLAEGIGGDPGHSVRQGVNGYLKATIEQDWLAMAKGGSSRAATLALDDIYARLLSYNPDDRRGIALMNEVLHQLDVMTQARRARLVLASGIVPSVIWLVLFGGAVLTVAFTFFFGTQNLRAQVVMTGALSVLIFSGLLVIVAIDRPFAGTVKVGPEGLAAVLEDFGVETP